MATTTKKKPAAKKTTTTKKVAPKSAKKMTPKEVLAMLKAKYDQVFDDGGVYAIKSNGKWGFADANGNVKIKPCYSALGDSWVEGAIAIWGTGGIGFLNKNLKEIVKPQFAVTSDFKNGIATVKKQNKWGIIDKNGKVVVPLVFDSMERYGNKIIAKIGSFEFVTK